MNFKEIQDSVADWLNRDDLGTRIPMFINNAQRSIERKFNFQYMEASEYYTGVTNHLIPVPNDYKNMKYAFVVNAYGDRVSLVKKDTKASIKIYPNFKTDVGQPKTISNLEGGTSFLLRPTPDTTYDIDLAYFAKSSELVNDYDTNWLTENAPDVLIYGALTNAEPFILSLELITLWQSRFDAELAAIGISDITEGNLGSYQVVSAGTGDII